MPLAGHRHNFALQFGDCLNLRSRIQLKNKCRHAAGDIDQLRTFQLGVDPLITHEANSSPPLSIA
jgi:hypothetical protein